MLLVILDFVYKLSVIGIVLNLILRYFNFKLDINKFEKEEIILTDDIKNIIKNELKPMKYEKTKTKIELINELKKELSSMNFEQVKDYLSSKNYLMGILSSNSSKKFVCSGRSVVLCKFKNNMFLDVLDIGDFTYNCDGLPGVNIF